MNVVLEFVGLSSLVFHRFMWLIILVIVVVLFFVLLVLMTMRMEDALEEPLVFMDGFTIRLFKAQLASNI